MSHHYHHHDGPHPSAALSPSLLRLSVGGRLALAAAAIASLWLAVAWAL